MTDIVDRAQLDEAMARRAAIWRASGGDRIGQGPDIVEGVPCCRDCGRPIPAARLLAMPGCCRCRACQERAERTRRQ